MKIAARNPKVKITHGDKLLYPASGITKQDIIEYYDRIADHMLPYMKDRPLTMRRFPNGIGREGFFQKNAPEHIPKWIKTVEVRKKGGKLTQLICNSRDTLIYLANLNVIEFHVTLSKKNKLNNPDKLVFDLDPSDDKFPLVVKCAVELRNTLEDLMGLQTFVMTSGSRGLHLVIPLEPVHDFDEVRAFAKKTAQNLCDRYPDEFTTEIRKEKRGSRLFIDCMRNSYAQTSIAPFSLRALEGAPVATPLSWKDLDDLHMNSQMYNIDTIFDKQKEEHNEWDIFQNLAFNLKDAEKILLVGYE